MVTSIATWTVVVLSVCASSALPFTDPDGKVAEYIEHFKRHSEDEIHGHAIGVLHSELPESGQLKRLTRRDIATHINHPSSAARRFVLELDNGQHIPMILERRNVVSPATRIVHRLAGKRQVQVEPTLDCFFTGSVDEHTGRATLGLCDQDVMGTVNNGSHHYEIQALPTSYLQKDEEEIGHVLVTWSDNPNRRSVDDLPTFENNGEENDEVVEIEARDLTPDAEAIQSRRAAKEVVAETAHFVAREWLDFTRNRYNRNNSPISDVLDWLTKVSILKYLDVAAMYRDTKNVFNVDVRLVHLEVWEEDPEWFDHDTTHSMLQRASSVCQYMGALNDPQFLFDIVGVETAGAGHPGVLGLAPVNTVCSKTSNCYSIRLGSIDTYVVAHEFSHTFGLSHSHDPCDEADAINEPNGVMAGNTYYRSCYNAAFETRWAYSSKDCLFWERYNSSKTLNDKALIGQALSFDELCQVYVGDGFKYRSMGFTACQLTCIGDDPTKMSYGKYDVYPAPTGTPCGQDKICYKSQCQWAEDLTSYVNTWRYTQDLGVVNGQYGDWTNSSDCAPDTDFSIATRQCDNPAPSNGGSHCDGPAVKAQSCRDIPFLPEGQYIDLAKTEGDAFCTAKQEAGLAHYTGLAAISRQTSQELGCMYSCGVSEGDEDSYLLPDESPCLFNPTFDEKMQGVSKTCFKGFCMDVGCDGATAVDGQIKVKDECGVCGGSGGGCVFSTFHEAVSGETSAIIVSLPANATNIYVAYHLISVWGPNMKLSSGDNTWAQPTGRKRNLETIDVDFAGTTWHFYYNYQSKVVDGHGEVKADGPISEPVTILLNNSRLKPVLAAIYRYTPPQ